MTLLDRLLGRPAQKAVTGAGVIAYQNDIPLNSWRYGDRQSQMAAFLRAYKVGWFYKAGRKISESVATLDWTISDGDAESEDPQETVLGRPDLDVPFDALNPIEQLMRLLEKPNPNYSGRSLLQKTQIRRDFAGTAMWYLEGVDSPSGLPTGIYGVSPARMWPSRNDQGQLIGWVLDKDSPGGGVPFSTDEIITFPMASADDDEEAGVGVVESVASELPLADMYAAHAADLLSTGGRLAGMAWPKNRSLSEPEFEDAKRAWRGVTSAGNAAKRLLLFPEPMEYNAGASTPKEIGIPELANLNRDNILTAFPIDPTMLGVQMPAGLNANGSTRREIKQEYWEGTVGTRADYLKETIQVKLVSRYERVMGQTFDFDFSIPNLDDAPSIIEKVGAFKGLVAVGFDPKEAVKAVALDHVKWLGLPDIMDPAKQAEMARQAAAAQKPDAGVTTTAGDTNRRDQSASQVQVAKSDEPGRVRWLAVGTKAVDDVADRHKAALAEFFAGQRDRVTEAIRKTFPVKTKRDGWLKAEPDWWDTAAENAALREVVAQLYYDAGKGSLQVVADNLERVVTKTAVNRVLDDLLKYGGERIADINANTLQAITSELAEGVRRGYSVNQMIDGVPAEDFKGVLNVGLDNGVSAWDEYRAEMIARTETALSYNRAAVTSYGEFGVQRLVAYDGDQDAECAARNGATFSIDEALSIEDHPNGTLSWSPVIEKAVDVDRMAEIAAKAIDALALTRQDDPQPALVKALVSAIQDESMKADDLTERVALALERMSKREAAQVTVNVPEQPAPVVNIAPTPAVVVPAPVVNVTPSSDVNLNMPARDKRVVYDRNGRIVKLEVIGE